MKEPVPMQGHQEKLQVRLMLVNWFWDISLTDTEDAQTFIPLSQDIYTDDDAISDDLFYHLLRNLEEGSRLYEVLHALSSTLLKQAYAKVLLKEYERMLDAQ